MSPKDHIGSCDASPRVDKLQEPPHDLGELSPDSALPPEASRSAALDSYAAAQLLEGGLKRAARGQEGAGSRPRSE